MSLTVDHEEGVLILTLDEPQRRNPIGHAVRQEIVRRLSDAERDGQTRAVVLTGAGGHFSTGGDIRDQKGVASRIEARDRFAVIKDLIGRMVRFPKPLVAAVEGWAAGGGFSLALACETVVAARSARFVSSFGKIGLAPDLGLLATLPARIGTMRAQRIFLTSATIDAEEGHRLGFVDELAPEGEALDLAKTIARQAAATAPLPRAFVKDFLAADVDRALEFERQVQPMLMFSADAVEGRTAFFEKRAPVFRGE
ncbi:enoyl-CoA hydratase/isomerase family protein [Nitratireductor sp. ZSWI3]|uniref:enoyl-CoA hydratase/isomerase family protein n=1 Tax=Nitratireductor sp. ZSWI3 TaxID=2966359 RepID=UPI00214FD38C|nr:enoyl-CoA hydratase/isomerase family protein [Nitratireductor sp. ZSWI3]MCR4265283.1 enoyl-CoA hydratase/isomerase family protein [Nitratireductor sp. ZSWI3]